MDERSYSMTLAAQFRRLISLLKLVDRSPGKWDVPALAGELGVSEATINRDLRLLRSVGKIRKVRKAGYVLEELCFLPTKLHPREAVALAVAAQSLESQSAAPLAQAARSGLRKVCRLQPPGVKALLGSLDQRVSVAPRAGRAPDARENLLDELTEAVLLCRTVQISYVADHTDELTTRRVDPYALHFGGSAWYVTGYCHLREAVRTFNVGRVRDLRVLEEPPFQRRDGFDLAKHLETGWRVWVEEGEHDRVRLRFQPDLADYIERTRWHPKQKTTRNPDGSVDFEVELAGLTEVTSWVLSFGSLVEVLEPPKLRARVRREAESMARQYAAGERTATPEARPRKRR
jgi:predicted DNA-binding transcriptional regulator YafY